RAVELGGGRVVERAGRAEGDRTVGGGVAGDLVHRVGDIGVDLAQSPVVDRFRAEYGRLVHVAAAGDRRRAHRPRAAVLVGHLRHQAGDRVHVDPGLVLTGRGVDAPQDRAVVLRDPVQVGDLGAGDRLVVER